MTDDHVKPELFCHHGVSFTQECFACLVSPDIALTARKLAEAANLAHLPPPRPVEPHLFCHHGVSLAQPCSVCRAELGVPLTAAIEPSIWDDCGHDADGECGCYVCPCCRDEEEES